MIRIPIHLYIPENEAEDEPKIYVVEIGETPLPLPKSIMFPRQSHRVE